MTLTTTPLAAIRSSRAGSASTPPAVKNVTCSRVSKPGLDGIGDGLGAVDVRGGGQSRAVGLIDHDPKGGQVVLRLVRLAAGA